MVGELRIGLERHELERLADPGAAVRKLSSRDLGWALAAGVLGATTVAGAIRIAALAGVRFLATGGIGGGHRARRGFPRHPPGGLFRLAPPPVARVLCRATR